jgi:hypothetical protein
MSTNSLIENAIQQYTTATTWNLIKIWGGDDFIQPYKEFLNNDLNGEHLTDDNIAKLVQILCKSQLKSNSEKEIYNSLLNLLTQSGILEEHHYNTLRELENKNAIKLEDYQHFLSLNPPSRSQLTEGAGHLLSANISNEYPSVKNHDEPHNAGYILNFYARSDRLKISNYIQTTSNLTKFADAIKIFNKNNIYELKQSQMEVVQKHSDPVNAAQAIVYLKRTPVVFSDLLTNENLSTISDHLQIDTFSSALGILVDDPENNRLNQEKFDILKDQQDPVGAAKIISCLEKTNFLFFDLLNKKNIDYIKKKKTDSFGDLPQALQILVKQAPELIDQEIFDTLITVGDPVNVAHAMICLKTNSRFFFSDFLTKDNIKLIKDHKNIKKFADALYVLQHNDNNKNYITQEIVNTIKDCEHPVELAEILICLKKNGLYNDNNINRAKINSKLTLEVINKFKEGNNLTSANLSLALNTILSTTHLHPAESVVILRYLQENNLDNNENIEKAEVNPTLLCAILNGFQRIGELTSDNLSWALQITSSYNETTDHQNVTQRAELLIFLKEKELATKKCIERVKGHSDVWAVTLELIERIHLGVELSSEMLFGIFDQLEKDQLPEYAPAPPIHNNQEHQGEADHGLEEQPVDADALPLFPPDYETLDDALINQDANVGFPAGDDLPTYDEPPTYDNLPAAPPGMRLGNAPVPQERPDAGHH